MKITNNSTRPKIRLIIFTFLVRLFFSDAYHLCRRHKKKNEPAWPPAIPPAGGWPSVEPPRVLLRENSYHPKGKEKVLLREAETCGHCGKVYLSLYPLRICGDHEGLAYVGETAKEAGE